MNKPFNRLGNKNSSNINPNTQEKGSNANAASADVIGSPFHNPYTFIPFPAKDQAPRRQKPTPLTIDEIETDRISGILELEVGTISPLLTCQSEPYKEEENKHKHYHALTIGRDVVLPASGIRGSLRTLMTILYGGTLGYLDQDLWLCQGRDCQLGPSKNGNAPHRVFLAEVVSPGDSLRSGTIRLGQTQLIQTNILNELFQKNGRRIDDERPKANQSQIKWYWIDDPKNPRHISNCEDDAHRWKLKLSGRKINRSDWNRDGAFLAGNTDIKLPADYWAAYQGRNRHGIRPELKKGDLIWLEPIQYEATSISRVEDIKSIQWARWGREGVSLREKLPTYLLPDSLRDDGKVDMVTDLFGQAPMEGSRAAGPYAARIRPHNLVFFDGLNHLETNVALAPLSTPHPGCIPFYREEINLDRISAQSPLKGFKIYRNTSERGKDAPWHYSTQGVYHEQGRLKSPAEQSVNKTVDLLKEGQTGKLRIAFRALNQAEMALLLLACSVDWRLGGGKPLGLGHCRVTRVNVLNEEGEAIMMLERDTDSSRRMILPAEYEKLVEKYANRIQLYEASQLPVKKLRYPRAVGKNENGTRREGLVWFGRHASPKKGQSSSGLETIWTRNELQRKAGGKTQIKAQTLPSLNPFDPEDDLLYGYDCLEISTQKNERKITLVGDIIPFDAGEHAKEPERRDENLSQNQFNRKVRRKQR